MPSTKAPTPLRCAVYTRKSNEEGLDQEYNSIDAQKDACHAYIAAKRGQGWRSIDCDYDDPVFSGGSLERPALKQLILDIEGGHIDVVVFYKMDRLTRSVADYSQLITLFDTHDVSFASVTEDFNTTNSAGRLSLNMSMSFAQYEREITAERIRDKIAASKRKGLWMGGIPPLGYDVHNRKLIINPTEAHTIQHLFERFTEIKSMTLLAKECQANGLTTKSWTTKDGKLKQGKLISKAFLYKLLKNRIYLGEISHREQWFNGEHIGIVEQTTWDAVQAIFAINRHERAGHTRAEVPFLLKGLLFDIEGYALTTWSTVKKKNGRRYRYYISSKDAKGYAGASELPRFQASELEKTIVFHLRYLLRSPHIIKAMEHKLPEMDEAQITVAMTQVDLIWETLFPDEQKRITQLLIQRITVTHDTIELLFHKNGIEYLACELNSSPKNNHALHSSEPIKKANDCEQNRVIVDSDGRTSVLIPYKVRRRSDKKIIVSSSTPEATTTITPLQTALIRGFKWEALLTQGKADSLKAIAETVGVDTSYVSRMVNLTTLAPDIIASILDETLPDSITLEKLAIGTPMIWDEQRKKLVSKYEKKRQAH